MPEAVAALPRLALGAPGVYAAPDSPVHALTGVRLDVAGFVGVAPRGPARVPVVDERHPADHTMLDPGRPRSRSVAVPVESFDEYVRVFGGFEAPGRLAVAVAAFFEQGGRRAHVIRIVHDFGGAADAGGVASGTLRGIHAGGARPVALRARSEGTWGDGLRARLSFAPRPLLVRDARIDALELRPEEGVPAATLLRLTLPGGTQTLRLVAFVERRALPDRPGTRVVAGLDLPLPAPPHAVEVVEAALEVDDGAGRRERFEHLGLALGHPAWIADVLCRDSELVWPDPLWAADALRPDDPALAPLGTKPFRGGEDRYAQIVPGDFFDPGWVPGDEPDTRVTAGVHALAVDPEVALVVVPDLYEPAAWEREPAVVVPARRGGAEFERCFTEEATVTPPPPAPALEGLVRDPTLPDDRAEIVGLQRRLVDLAEAVRSFVVLLDVPPGLTQRAMLEWRAEWDSMWAAAYHPWLRTTELGPPGGATVRVNPAAAAAGIVAAAELRAGVQRGPANELVARVVDVEDRVGAARHDELHQAAINVFLLERDGVRLTAARTLSRDAAWRQLSVRRLVTMIERSLERRLRWTVFEPNDAELRGALRHGIEGFLRALYLADALRGATEEEAFFVRPDPSRATADLGRLVVEVGVAPAEPLEFIVVRLARDGDGTLVVEAEDG
jgi:Bacteriophage tail sheath protein